MSPYLAIISGIVKFCNYVAGALQQHHDELNGANKQKVADNEARIKTLGDLTAPIGTAESDKLWRENVAKFGPPNISGADAFK